MSIYYTLRSYWWDAALLGRHLWKDYLKGVWWDFLLAWKSATPKLYHWLENLKNTQQPAVLKDVSDDTYGTVATVDGIRMRIDRRMSIFQVRKLLRGRHTQHERHLVGHRLEPNDVVMELGGGIGMLAIACAKKIGGERVYSYEANPNLEPLIRDNYALNDVTPNLKMCMLKQAAGTCTFYISEHFARSSAHKLDDQEMKPCEVAVESLNDEIHRVQPTVLIMDVQGSEEELLGFADLSGIRKLLVEMHPKVLGVSRVNALRRQLRKQGFLEVERAGQNFFYVRKK